MKQQKSHISAQGSRNTVHIQAVLGTDMILTPDESRHERKRLNDLLAEALHKFGFHYQDIEVK